MCGISVIVNQKDQPVSNSQVKAMCDKVIHRGPDDEGYFFEANFAFGHRRLSIIDTSFAGHQPMSRGSNWIVYNGMLYNYLELRNELMAAGQFFHSQTDTEVILAAYQQWGTDAFKRFNGMWAFAIYDYAAQRIVLCRDHFGIKPMYYTTAGDFFLVASEIKQFTGVPQFKPVLNECIAINFLTKGLLNYSHETFFENVYALNAGNYLVYDLRTHSSAITEWYNLHKEAKPVDATEQEAIATVRSLFESSVKLRMRADVQVGSCLSGGVDSSSIVSMIYNKQLANRHFTTFTSCYHSKDYDEQQYSDLVSRHTGFPAVKVFPDLDDLFSKKYLDTMIYHQDQPMASASHYSEFQVFKTARENNITVMLDGQGSDEYLCGYSEFFASHIAELLRGVRLSAARRLVRMKGSHGGGTKKVVSDLFKVLYGEPLIRFVKNVMRKPEYVWLSKKYRRVAEKCLQRFAANNVYDLSLLQLKHTSIPYQLHSEDRNSMLFSIESRLPFLDHRLVEYVVALPGHLKIKNGYSKYIFRVAMKELPEPIRWRKDKMGFVAPEKEWMRENSQLVRKQLQAVVNETLFFSPELLNRFDRFVKGELQYEQVYFRAITFYRFLKVFDMKMPSINGSAAVVKNKII